VPSAVQQFRSRQYRQASGNKRAKRPARDNIEMSQTQNLQCLNFGATAYQTQNTQQLKVDLRFLNNKDASEYNNQNEWD